MKNKPNLIQRQTPGYCLYGGQTILVLTMGQGVQGFTLNKEGGDFILTHPDMRIPKRGALYALNEGSSFDWDPRVFEWLKRMKLGEGKGNQPHRSVRPAASFPRVISWAEKGRQQTHSRPTNQPTNHHLT